MSTTTWQLNLGARAKLPGAMQVPEDAPGATIAAVIAWRAVSAEPVPEPGVTLTPKFTLHRAGPGDEPVGPNLAAGLSQSPWIEPTPDGPTAGLTRATVLTAIIREPLRAGEAFVIAAELIEPTTPRLSCAIVGVTFTWQPGHVERRGEMAALWPLPEDVMIAGDVGGVSH